MSIILGFYRLFTDILMFDNLNYLLLTGSDLPEKFISWSFTISANQCLLDGM